MRRVLALLGIIGVVALIVWLGSQGFEFGDSNDEQVTPEPTATSSVTAPSASPSATPGATAAPKPSPPATATPQAPGTDAHPAIPVNARETTVRYVHDGDTLYLHSDPYGNERDPKVRLLGIDTPELQPRAECGAVTARDALRQLVPDGTRVWAARDIELYDPYDRQLLYLWLEDGTFVNLAMIEDGHAEAVRFMPNEAYWPLLRSAEREAAADRVGIWGNC